MAARAALAVSLAVAATVLGGCHRGGAPEPPAVALVGTTPAFGGDLYNGAAAAGLRACATQLHAVADVAQPATPDDLEAQLVLAATENRDAIVGVGTAAGPIVQRVARRFPTSHFALVDGDIDEANVDSVVFKSEEGAYLAGALAAMMSPHHHVAFLGGEPGQHAERYAAGFIAGARRTDARAQVDLHYAGSYTDRAAAHAAADALYRNGADVVFTVAGSAGLGAIEAAAARRGVYAIGADADQDALARGVVLTSVVKNVAPAVERVCADTVAQKPVTGRDEVGLAEGAVALTGFRYTRAAIGAAKLQRLDDLRAAIVRGTLRPPASLAAASHAVALR